MQTVETTYGGFASEERILVKESGAVTAYKQDDIGDIKIEERKAAAEIDSVGKYEPKLTENGIPADVLAKLLPGDDVLELIEPKVCGGLGYRFVKRAFDVVSCGCALIALAIPMAIIAAKIKLESSGPAIYSQRRVGKDGKIFNVYKFRSMYTDAETRGARWAAGNDPRVTPFGKFMREKRIDEIPQFWNIVKGDMSIIGPRPQLVRDMVFMTPEQRKRHLVRPGLSGLAQVNGRNAIAWDDKLAYDLKYIERITFAGDAAIFFKTIAKAFVKQEGITEEGMATAADYGDYLLAVKRVTPEEYNGLQAQARQLLEVAR